MRALAFLLLFTWLFGASATILENGQARLNPYPGQTEVITLDKKTWRTYKPGVKEISYKGRWDDKAPGFKLAFTGERLALSFGQYTSQGVLVAYRLGGQDWQFSNVTANATYQFIGPTTTGLNLTKAGDIRTFELRDSRNLLTTRTIQLAGVSVAADAKISRVPEYPRMVEIIGDSLSSGDYATYEGLSSWAYDFAAGLGNVEYSITVRSLPHLLHPILTNKAYPGICLHDQNCWGNPRGQAYQWYRTSDTSWRAHEIYGDNPPRWNFAAQRPADLVVINIGTNDNNPTNNVSSIDYYNDYVNLVGNIHKIWPKANIVLMSLWGGFGASGDTYVQGPIWVDEIKRVYQHYEKQGFIHYFDTTGILQHNDIAPQWHPTDVGHIKIAAHLMQWVKLKFGWEFGATGPEVHHGTLYWNDQANY
ncbi:hypothetical protein IFM58399_02489 [Aspergillus lentulus]|uniref:SGNH/GDSL hydrolase family protein n=1 Tax=Aspergillus lentulus TaxID=293939 RepID=UPI0013934AE3|nr:uncharacterized protein IFM58399_02489 [Aspergillus lentulus]GFF30142.1 hypothetical protein IFM58399_02489 [Aspergillus lentulus]GFF99315.1 hypothetical protein IFM61392_00767 [Aspergillus lentulus]